MTAARQLWKASSLMHHYANISLDAQRCTLINCTIMDQAEYERIKEDLKVEYEEKLRALEIIWGHERKRAGENVQDAATVTWAEAVRQVLPTLGRDFDKDDVEKAVAAKFRNAKNTLRKNSLSGVLTRLEQRGLIEVVKAGGGPVPNRYRLKN